MSNSNNTTKPLISLRAVTRSFKVGDQHSVTVLDNISLEIYQGEMVAIVGASGSGKSTLMNIMGCLDKPTSGGVCIVDTETALATNDQLSELRSQHIGFIFQKYHLIPYLSAIDNVMVPSGYTALSKSEQRQRAETLLTNLGLGERLLYKPSQLSGGQQQRVSIARALMNGANIILADEPTGALDRQNSQDLMDYLDAMRKAGHTIILVTHDQNIAKQADRMIELQDGCLIKDTYVTNELCKPAVLSDIVHGSRKYINQGISETAATRIEAAITNSTPLQIQSVVSRATIWQNIYDSFLMACRALGGNPLRAFLAMLGIIIGISSVISTIAVGEGIKQKVLDDLKMLSAETLSIRPGPGWDNQGPEFSDSLSMNDVTILKEQAFIPRVSPLIIGGAETVVDGKNANVNLYGVNQDYFFIRGMMVKFGRTFLLDDIDSSEPAVVIDEQTAKKLFPNTDNPVGTVLQLSGVPFIIIGIVKPKRLEPLGNNLNAWVSYTALSARFKGNRVLTSIEVEHDEGISLMEAQRRIEHLLLNAHGRLDFFIYTDDLMLPAVDEASNSLTTLITTIAVISLIVGGVGVMNIMLVSVVERTREIGIRLAVGATRINILHQFIFESVLVCIIGCIVGILLVWGGGSLFSLLNNEYKLIFTWEAILLSCAFSTIIGFIFGFFPARSAASLDPVKALIHE